MWWSIKILFAVLTALAAWKYYIHNYPKTLNPPNVGGYCHPGFEKVADVLRKNVESGFERGAAFSVYHKGEVLVDIYGGWADVEAERPWREDTISISFSMVKGISAMVVAKLVDMGLLDYKKEVHHYWPDFASHGKKNVTVEMLMSHQAGLVGLDEKFTLYDVRDKWEKVEKIIATSKPMWPPGTAVGYHAYTMGMFADALLRRVDPKHRNISQFFEDEFAKPFGIDFHIGIPKELYYRYARINVASLWEYRFDILDFIYVMTSPWLSKMVVVKHELTEFSDPELLAIGQPSAMGIGSARGLAKLYDYLANGGSIKGKKMFSKAAVDALVTPITGHLPNKFILDLPVSPGLIIRKNKQGHDTAGHPGYGGNQAFADRTISAGISYTTNHLGGYLRDDPREVTLLETFYECFNKYKSQKQS